MHSKWIMKKTERQSKHIILTSVDQSIKLNDKKRLNNVEISCIFEQTEFPNLLFRRSTEFD